MIQEEEMKHQHFLILSYPIQGHINPTLQLAKNLARRGTAVTFATTTRTFKRLRDTLPTIKGLSYTSFSDGYDDAAPKAGDWTIYMADMRKNSTRDVTGILKSFQDEGPKVTCLVYSILFPWAAVVARELHVPSAFLVIQSATAFAIYYRIYNSDDGIHHDGITSSVSVTIPELPVFESADLPSFVLPDSFMHAFMAPMMVEHMKELEKDPKSLVFINTFQELEEEAIKALENKLNLVAVGPLIPSSAFSEDGGAWDTSFGGDLFEKSEEDQCFRWLDSKPEKSVVYVAFGSLVALSKAQKVEILHGLVESGRPFLWVIRSTEGEEEDEVKKMLENELNGDGMIVSWCSQAQVLTHTSIGCFVTHCGWNSTLESLSCGVPLIGCPHFSDQTTNAKMVDQVWGIGVRARANGEEVLGREQLKKCVDTVMGDGQRGKEIRANACKLRRMAIEAVGDGGSTFNNLNRVLKEYSRISGN